MPIANIDDAPEVEERLNNILDARDDDSRATAMRLLLTETLDWDYADRLIALGSARSDDLRRDARLIASRDGFSAVYIPLTDADTNRITAATVNAAARYLNGILADDLLLLFTNADGGEFHIILPSFASSRPTLQRMVARRGQHHRTVVQQVANMWEDYGRRGKTMYEALRAAFSVEPVTQKFFQAYKRVFDEAEAKITGFADDADGIERKRRFTQMLFNRLMFIYFVSRKGWLSFQDEYGNGDTDYLNALRRDYESGKTADSNFYWDRLRLLFFAGLNNPKSEDLTEYPDALRLIGSVPFLNGGLFEKNELDSRSDIYVPDDAIVPILTDLFDPFNFTVMESTPYDTEVAVDPEMLGKVFEELVNARHESGAYYTPRPVVSFMCREALKGFLASAATGLSDDAISGFVDAQSTQDISVADARKVAAALERVTVVDPACGSGAYLLGMMQELVDLQTTLFNAGVDAKSIYDLKLEIIRRNLFGVDIDDFAVNIAMLRLWLSLVIEYEDDVPPPLPNLDFKIACGDSLLAPDPDPAQQGNIFTEAIRVSGLGDLKSEYMRARAQPDKDRLRAEIVAAQAQIKDTLGDAGSVEGAIDWRVEFAEVMGYGGFDIVVANPPYVRQENIANKPALVSLYADAVTARSDLYCHFYARALQLLRDGGMHIFVCSNSWLDVGYGAKLQEHLLNAASVEVIYESAVERQFSTAQINTIVSVIRKGRVDNDRHTRFVSLRAEFESAIADADLRREITMSRASLMEAGLGSADSRGRRRYVGDKWGGKYLRAPDIYHHIVTQYGDRLVRLGEVAAVRFGIKTGANRFFYLTEHEIEDWGVEPEYLRPVMTSPQESRSIAVDADSLPKQLFMCHADRRDLASTGALDYIRWGEDQGYHQRSSTRSRPRWYDLGRKDRVHLGLNKLVGSTARSYLSLSGLRFTDNFQIMILQDGTSAVSLCATLNSTLFQLMLNTEARANFGEGVLEIQTYETANLPVTDPSLLGELDSEIFSTADWDVLTPSAERLEIDAAVFDALGLTAGEREAVYEGVSELVGNRLKRAQSV